MVQQFSVMNAVKRSRVEDGTMSINKFNPEGYYDPTPYEALSNVTREEKAASKPAFRPLVYICSPFSGDTERNIKRAQDFCRFALEKGNIPLAPHLMFPQFMDDNNEKERDLAIFMDIIPVSYTHLTLPTKRIV